MTKLTSDEIHYLFDLLDADEGERADGDVDMTHLVRALLAALSKS